MMAVSALALSCASSRAFELNGAWATDASVCEQVFVKKGNKVFFRETSELYGGGFIVEGRNVTGQIQNCTVKSVKQDGASVRVIAACSTGVSISDEQFDVKVVNENQITMMAKGMGDMGFPYTRCPM
jgi:hypothetical protein